MDVSSSSITTAVLAGATAATQDAINTSQNSEDTGAAALAPVAGEPLRHCTELSVGQAALCGCSSCHMTFDCLDIAEHLVLHLAPRRKKKKKKVSLLTCRCCTLSHPPSSLAHESSEANPSHVACQHLNEWGYTCRLFYGLKM